MESATVQEVAASFETEKPAAAVVAAAAAESDTTGNNEGGLRLPQKLVDYLLSWKPLITVDPDEYYARRINDPASTREYVERSTNTMRDVAELSKRCANMMVEYKAWMRGELEEKGYVEVDDDYIARGVRLSQELEEDDDFPEAFGPIDGLVLDATPQCVIDEIDCRRITSEST